MKKAIIRKTIIRQDIISILGTIINQTTCGTSNLTYYRKVIIEGQ